MIIVSIDIETSGLDPDKNQVLSIGAIIEDTTKKLSFDECPKFNAIVLQREIVGSPRALTINKNIISIMSDYLESNENVREEIKPSSYGLGNIPIKFYEEDEVIPMFFDFLYNNGFGDIKESYLINGNTKPITINVAGKNFGTFDKLFLEKLKWWKKLIRTRSRIIDPAILCCDWEKDNCLPSLFQCKERKNIDGVVTHNALEDAWDVIQILRKFY